MTSTTNTKVPPQSELAAALGSCRGALVGVGMISSMVNILMLTGSFFMLQVYDRVLASGSLPTLVGLAILAGSLYVFQGILDGIRLRLLARIGSALDEPLSPRVHDIVLQLPLRGKANGDSLQVLRDLDQIRSYISGMGPTAFFDLPWMPLYLAICFVFHPIIGMVALGGAVILVGLTVLTEFLGRKPSQEASKALAARNTVAETGRRNAEVIRAMGLSGRLDMRFQKANGDYLAAQRRAGDVAGGMGAASRVMRMVLQSAILATGAWLAILQEVSPGVMIAASIMMSRALAPVELAISHSRAFASARQSWSRLKILLVEFPATIPPMSLPAPKALLAIEKVSVVPPGSKAMAVREVSFSLEAGQALGIIGPSASGKSSLARAIVGVWSPARGNVRIDGAALDQWDPQALGPHVGYMPQTVELFSGTIADNIARLEDAPDPKAVIEAARAADIHEMILRMPEGYETQIGDGGSALSAGQRQRLGLARALYGNPFLVVLDEPNSNLDHQGEVALSRAITAVRERGGIAIVIAHRQNAIQSVDLVLMMQEGATRAFGPRDEVLKSVLQAPATGHPSSGARPKIAAET